MAVANTRLVEQVLQMLVSSLLPAPRSQQWQAAEEGPERGHPWTPAPEQEEVQDRVLQALQKVGPRVDTLLRGSAARAGMSCLLEASATEPAQQGCMQQGQGPLGAVACWGELHGWPGGLAVQHQAWAVMRHHALACPSVATLLLCLGCHWSPMHLV